MMMSTSPRGLRAAGGGPMATAAFGPAGRAPGAYGRAAAADAGAGLGAEDGRRARARWGGRPAMRAHLLRRPLRDHQHDDPHRHNRSDHRGMPTTLRCRACTRGGASRAGSGARLGGGARGGRVWWWGTAGGGGAGGGRRRRRRRRHGRRERKLLVRRRRRHKRGLHPSARPPRPRVFHLAVPKGGARPHTGLAR